MIAAFLCSTVPAFSQAFIAEWTASANGGVGPTGTALATESGTTYLYVSDHPRGRIIKFNAATGAVAATFGTVGNGNGQFNQPYGIGIDPTTGDLYVAERANNRIQRVTNTGTFVMAWGAAGNAAGQFMEPIGVAVDAAGDVYVTEHGNHRVQKFHVTQTAGGWSAANVTMWGSQGSGNGQFNAPYGMAIDAANNVWVADGVNGRVQRFNTSGVYQSTVGGAGTAPGQFVVATGVTTDATGALYVTSTNSDPQNAAAADASSQWVSKFSPAGTFVSRWGGAYGGGPSQFRLPFSVAVSAGNRAYVADYYNSRVQVFDLAAAPDTGAPTVSTFTIGSNTATSVTYQLTFSEPVTGVDSADFATVVTGGAAATVGSVSGSGATYSIPVTFTGTGTVQLNLNPTGTGIADLGGTALAGGATGPVYTIGGGGSTDTTPPAVASFTIATSTPTSVTYQITFSESVTGVNSADFTAVTAGGATATVGTVTGSGAAYSIPVTFTGTTGTIQLKLNASGTGIVDASNNAIAAGANGPVYTIAASDDGKGSGPVTVLKRGDGLVPGQPFTLPATTASGQPITWILVSGNATLKGNVLTPKNRGAVVVRGVVAGSTASSNINYRFEDDDDDKDSNGRGNSASRNRLSNLSSRLRVSSADANRTGIGGFVVTGKAPKQVLVRAVGPGLATFGVPDAVPAARLDVRSQSGALIAQNDGWVANAAMTAAEERVGAFKLAPGSRDSALLLTLNPGAYTALVGANGSGIALLEVYDATGAAVLSTEQLINISTRGFVDSGDGNLIAGFVVTGDAPKRVLMRGIGAALAGFGVAGALADPVLELYTAGGAALLARSDNWETPPNATAAAATTTTAAEILAATRATGAFPLASGSKDAAILITLMPGSYSAVVSGANRTTGAGLVEVYEVPNP